MNITSRPAAPAGWYQDPRGLPQLRFWNGTTWTNQVTTAERRADSGHTRLASWTSAQRVSEA